MHSYHHPVPLPWIIKMKGDLGAQGLTFALPFKLAYKLQCNFRSLFPSF